MSSFSKSDMFLNVLWQNPPAVDVGQSENAYYNRNIATEVRLTPCRHFLFTLQSFQFPWKIICPLFLYRREEQQRRTWEQ